MKEEHKKECWLHTALTKYCNCKDEETDPAGGDNSDDNFSVASSQASHEIYESYNPDLLILKNGFYRETGALVNKLKRGFAYIEPDQSPLELKDIPPILVIPTGGLYGMENSEQFKTILIDYVAQGGKLIVLCQQHGYEFSVLPTPDNKLLESIGWREDQSCSVNSIYVDTWHPVLSSATKTLISNPIDGYFAGYPSNSTVHLRRRVNGMPAMLAYPFGEGWVVVTSLFTDWVGFIQDRRIVRDLITWAKNPDLEIPDYNLRDNPDPEVSLNLEIKNISSETASNVKILWLDPDRNLYFEEEKLVSIPAGEEMTLPLSQSFSDIPDSELGIWHVDYVLYDSEGNEIQPQAETDLRRFKI